MAMILSTELKPTDNIIPGYRASPSPAGQVLPVLPAYHAKISKNFYNLESRVGWEHLSGHERITAEGSIEIKLPTIWTDEAAKVGRVREEKGRRRKTQEDQRRERVSRKKIPMFCFGAPEGPKVGSQKQRVRSHLGIKHCCGAKEIWKCELWDAQQPSKCMQLMLNTHVSSFELCQPPFNYQFLLGY